MQRDVYCFWVYEYVSSLNIIQLAEATQSAVTSCRSGWLTHNYVIGALLLCYTKETECSRLASLLLVLCSISCNRFTYMCSINPRELRTLSVNSECSPINIQPFSL